MHDRNGRTDGKLGRAMKMAMVGGILLVAGYYSVCVIHCDMRSPAVSTSAERPSGCCTEGRSDEEKTGGGAEGDRCCTGTLSAYPSSSARLMSGSDGGSIIHPSAMLSLDRVDVTGTHVVNGPRVTTEGPPPALIFLAGTIALRAPPLA